MAFEKQEGEVGVLLEKQSKKGRYFTGNIDGIGPVVVFAISSQNPKAPNWRVLKSVPKGDKPQGKDIGGGFTVEQEDIGF